MMTRESRFDTETDWVFVGITEYLEMLDNATDEGIEDEARDIFFNHCNYGVSEVEQEEE